MKPLKGAHEYLQGTVAILTGAAAYEYMPFLRSETEIKSYFGRTNDAGDTVINGWAIEVESAAAESDTAEGRIDYTFHRHYAMILNGYYGLRDGSEAVTFRDQIEALMDGLDADPQLGGTCDEALPPVLRRRDVVVLANVACHHCELALTLRMKRDRI